MGNFVAEERKKMGQNSVTQKDYYYIYIYIYIGMMYASHHLLFSRPHAAPAVTGKVRSARAHNVHPVASRIVEFIQFYEFEYLNERNRGSRK